VSYFDQLSFLFQYSEFWLRKIELFCFKTDIIAIRRLDMLKTQLEGSKEMRKRGEKTVGIVMLVFLGLVFSCDFGSGPADENGGTKPKDPSLEWVTVVAGPYKEYANVEASVDYDYQIGKYEITNQQYAQYLEKALTNGDITVTTTTVEGEYNGDTHWSSGTYEYFDLDSMDSRIAYSGGAFVVDTGYEDHPVTCVSWIGANAFAQNYGWALPTDQEWAKAVRGNTTTNFTWGSEPSPTHANYVDSGDPFDNGTTPVGYYDGGIHDGFQTSDSPSPYGAYDMLGNVYEFVDEFFGPSSPTNRAARGGSFSDQGNFLHFNHRIGPLPEESNRFIGFRVVNRN
jgi:formylglycine-generating enzyme required for sulfatase activity